ncbi:hypothetical protein CLF_102711 [Clonorchis sinensis]|uniref:Uncharacterized protein n=1 Tax=Clonorchis sinensis TaxID=79923 RepID=G7Y8E3_CLOSI|nr:hypothetical protein CLF_102711 [Clonorchis sinensis]
MKLLVFRSEPEDVRLVAKTRRWNSVLRDAAYIQAAKKFIRVLMPAFATSCTHRKARIHVQNEFVNASSGSKEFQRDSVSVATITITVVFGLLIVALICAMIFIIIRGCERKRLDYAKIIRDANKEP